MVKDLVDLFSEESEENTKKEGVTGGENQLYPDLNVRDGLFRGVDEEDIETILEEYGF